MYVCADIFMNLSFQAIYFYQLPKTDYRLPDTSLPPLATC